MGYHREVVTIALENFIVNMESCFACRTIFINFRNINALKKRVKTILQGVMKWSSNSMIGGRSQTTWTNF